MTPPQTGRFAKFEDDELTTLIERLEAEDVDSQEDVPLCATLALEARIEQSRRRKHGNWSSSVTDR